MKKKKASFHAYLISLNSQGMLNYLRNTKAPKLFLRKPLKNCAVKWVAYFAAITPDVGILIPFAI